MRPRRLGWAIILYSFVISFYGVSSIKNCVSGHDRLTHIEFVLAAVYGASWAALIVSGAALSRARMWGVKTLFISSAGMAVADTAAIFLYASLPPVISALPDMVLLAKPLPDIFLLKTAYTYRFPGSASDGHGDAVSADAGVNGLAALAIVTGAILPLLSGLLVNGSVARLGQAIRISTPMGKFSVVFMGVWFGLPLCAAYLSSQASGSQGSRGRLYGSLAGILLADMYLAKILWSPFYNGFVMALSPPLACACGILGGLLASYLPQRRRLQR